MSAASTVVLSGNLGAGKTTLISRLLGSLPQSTAVHERRDVYWQRYCAEPRTYAFRNQLAYSLQHLENAIRISSSGTGIVLLERSILDSFGVFTRMMHKDGTISDDEVSLLARIYDAAVALWRPSMAILLDVPAEVALARVQSRMSSFEERLTLDFLAKLGNRYREWFKDLDFCPKLVIRTDELGEAEAADLVLQAMSSALRSD